MINFGNIYYPQKATQTIEIENIKKTEISLTVIECPEYIKLEIKPKMLAPGERGKIQVTFDSNFKDIFGSSKDKPMIRMEMGKQIQKGSINIMAEVVEDFSKITAEELAVAPVIYFPEKSINIGEIEAKEIKSIEIDFENRGRSELMVHSVEINHIAFILTEFDKIVEPGGKGKIKIETNPAYVAAALDVRVNVIANAPKSSKTILRVYGRKKIPKPVLKESKSVETEFKNIKVDYANNLMKEYNKNGKLVVLDVRTSNEYENGCLPGALNFDVENTNFSKIIQLLDRSKMYIVYCKSGIRSEEAVAIMSELGFKNVYHMNEGMDGWKDSRLEISDPGK